MFDFAMDVGRAFFATGLLLGLAVGIGVGLSVGQVIYGRKKPCACSSSQ